MDGRGLEAGEASAGRAVYVAGTLESADPAPAPSGLVSDIGFGFGIAGVALGTFLLLNTSDAERPTPRTNLSSKASLRVWVLPTSAGFRGVF